jgi:hypothetical protein
MPQVWVVGRSLVVLAIEQRPVPDEAWASLIFLCQDRDAQEHIDCGVWDSEEETYYNRGGDRNHE